MVVVVVIFVIVVVIIEFLIVVGFSKHKSVRKIEILSRKSRRLGRGKGGERGREQQ